MKRRSAARSGTKITLSLRFSPKKPPLRGGWTPTTDQVSPASDERAAEGGAAPEERAGHVGPEDGHPGPGPRLELGERPSLRELGADDVEVVDGDALDEGAVRLVPARAGHERAPVDDRRAR